MNTTMLILIVVIGIMVLLFGWLFVCVRRTNRAAEAARVEMMQRRAAQHETVRAIKDLNTETVLRRIWDNPGPLGGVVFLIGLGLGFIAMAEPGHHADPSSAESRWYEGLRQPGTGLSCCNERDCVPTSARMVDGVWRAVSPAGIEVDIPEDRVLRGEVHPAGAAVLCWQPTPGVLCFVPPIAGG